MSGQRLSLASRLTGVLRALHPDRNPLLLTGVLTAVLLAVCLKDWLGELLLFGVPVLLLVLLLSEKRGRYLLLLASFVVSLVGFCFLGNRLLRGKLGRVYDITKIDHRMKPGLPDLPTNSDGIRSRREARSFSAKGTNIIFLGDSFTFGLRVNLEQAFPMLVEAQLRKELGRSDLRVANFGWTSSSPLLSYRLLRDVGHKYRPDLVVLCIDMTDPAEDLHYRRWLDKVALYWLTQEQPALTWLLNISGISRLVDRIASSRWRWGGAGYPSRTRIDGTFHSRWPLKRSRPYFREIVRSMELLDRYSRKLGARFAVFVLPRSYQYSTRESPKSWEKYPFKPMSRYVHEPFRFFRRHSRKVSHPLFARTILEAFLKSRGAPTCFEDDPHWNPRGHRIAARAVTQALLRRGLVSRVEGPTSRGSSAAGRTP